MTGMEPETARAAHSPLTAQRVRSASLFLAPMLLVLAAAAGWPLARTVYF
ncbi:sugar ABC transporter permease, partial [Mesorhizobium sp. M7A.F.Ca.MR.228.00.0.0]